MIREKPMLFVTENIKGIFENRKTMTRRIIKKLHKDTCGIKKIDNDFYESTLSRYNETFLNKIKCPYEIGMHLWCKETFNGGKDGIPYAYKASNPELNGIPWKPSIFMPRAASRITLEVVDIKVEKIQEISDYDIRMEGIELPLTDDLEAARGYIKNKWIDLWDSINAKPKPKFKNKIIIYYESFPWSEDTADKRITINDKPHYCYPNPWVWCTSFKRIDK